MMLLSEGGSQHQRVGRGLISPSLIFERITKLVLKKSGGGGGRRVRSSGKLKLLDRDSNLWFAGPTFSQLNYEVKSANVTHSNRLDKQAKGSIPTTAKQFFSLPCAAPQNSII
jgi:hypothetical protein